MKKPDNRVALITGSSRGEPQLPTRASLCTTLILPSHHRRRCCPCSDADSCEGAPFRKEFLPPARIARVNRIASCAQYNGPTYLRQSDHSLGAG